jgi:hypothetical protein
VARGLDIPWLHTFSKIYEIFTVSERSFTSKIHTLQDTICSVFILNLQPLPALPIRNAPFKNQKPLLQFLYMCHAVVPIAKFTVPGPFMFNHPQLAARGTTHAWLKVIKGYLIGLADGLRHLWAMTRE